MINFEWNTLDSASQSIKQYEESMKMNPKSSDQAQDTVDSKNDKLEFIAHYKDPYLEKSIELEQMLIPSDRHIVDSSDNYNDSSSPDVVDDLQISEKEKVPAFYRNSLSA